MKFVINIFLVNPSNGSIAEPIVAKWSLNIIEIFLGSLIRLWLLSTNLKEEDFKDLIWTSDLIPFQMSEDFCLLFSKYEVKLFTFGNFIS